MEGKRKHLTLADRIQIERGLDSNKNFTEIGKEIGKDPTTVSKEVRKHIHAKGRYMPARPVWQTQTSQLYAAAGMYAEICPVCSYAGCAENITVMKSARIIYHESVRN